MAETYTINFNFRKYEAGDNIESGVDWNAGWIWNVEELDRLLDGPGLTTATISEEDYIAIAVDGSTIELSNSTKDATIRIKDGGVGDDKIASGINAAKIGSGDVSNAEFAFLDGVSSSIQGQIDSLQSQINAKAPIDSPTFTTQVTLADTTLVPNGGTIGQAAGPLLTFNDTNNYLGITGCRVGLKTATPAYNLDIIDLATNNILGIRAYSETWRFTRPTVARGSPAVCSKRP